MTKVLIVDDNPDIRMITMRILKQLGCEIEAHPTTQSAFKVLHNGNPFDVIFVDLHMPGLDGIEFTKRVKVQYPDARIVLTSSSAPTPETYEDAMTQGVDYCIFSDHNKENYQTALTAVLGQK